MNDFDNHHHTEIFSCVLPMMILKTTDIDPGVFKANKILYHNNFDVCDHFVSSKSQLSGPLFCPLAIII